MSSLSTRVSLLESSSHSTGSAGLRNALSRTEQENVLRESVSELESKIHEMKATVGGF